MKQQMLFRRVMAAFLAGVLLLGLVAMVASAEENAEPVNMMRKFEDLTEIPSEIGPDMPFWGLYELRRSWIHRVEFHDTMEGAPANIIDFSANFDKSVIGWYTPNTMHVAANGKITLNPDSSWLFAYCSNLEAVEFNGCVDTSLVTDMEAMFFCCGNLENLDVSFFDTAKVTNMSRMFAYCGKIDALDLSGFDTSNVENFAYMFMCMRNLDALDVSGFNTANAMYMNSMFYHLDKVQSLDVTGFDTSKVITMVYMFDKCSDSLQVDVSGFNTGAVRFSSNFMNPSATVNGEPWTAMFR